MQAMVLTFELGAPLWFAMKRTRGVAFLFGLGMHAMIGLMFGPVVWFALLLGGWAPDAWFLPLDKLTDRLMRRAPEPRPEDAEDEEDAGEHAT
jgi:hypothetical protein